MKNKTHLNMPGFKLPHMGSEKQVGPYKSALHKHTPGHNEPSFAPVSTPPSFHDAFALGAAMGAGVGSSGTVDPFDVDYSGAKPVDLGTVKLSDEGRATKGFRDEFGNYMGREFKGNDERLGRITPQQNFQEAMRELPEKYFDLEKNKLRYVPTDDAEMPDEEFKSKLKPYQLFNPEMFSDQQPKDE